MSLPGRPPTATRPGTNTDSRHSIQLKRPTRIRSTSRAVDAGAAFSRALRRTDELNAELAAGDEFVALRHDAL